MAETVKNKENVIEFLTGEKHCCVSFTQTASVNRLKKLYKEHSEDFQYFYENADGSVCGSIPLSWVRITPKKKTQPMTDEKREALKKQLVRARTARREKQDGEV